MGQYISKQPFWNLYFYKKIQPSPKKAKYSQLNTIYIDEECIKNNLKERIIKKLQI